MALDEKYSMRYQVVVLAEALGSICLHIAIEDFGYEPKSYAECFKLLKDNGLVGPVVIDTRLDGQAATTQYLIGRYATLVYVNS